MTDTNDSAQYAGIGFVRLPNESYTEAEIVANPMLCLPTDLPDLMGALSIGMRAQQFNESQNPVIAIEAFILAIDAGVFPPVSILQWLADGFREYHDGQGKEKTLDKVLGLTGSNGSVPPFNRLLLNQRDEMLFMDMDMLMYLGVSREKAAELVANRLENTDWNKSRWEMSDPKDSTLEDKHARSGRARLDDATATLLGLHDKAKVALFLGKFSQNLLPPQLKKLV